MSDIILNNSAYQIGSIDTATVLVNNVSPIDARHVNGPATAIIQIETILGTGTSLKGSKADLAERLTVHANADGTIKLAGFTGLTTDRGLIATNSTTLGVSNHTPVGVVQAYAGQSIPVHWLLCDGSAVSRTTYSKLFAVIGSTYGSGDGSTTFNLPDLRGRVIVMIDGAANRITSASTNGGNADTLGGVGGAQTHTLVSGEMPAHTHTAGTQVEVSTGSGTFVRDVQAANTVTSSTGGGGAHSNTQPWMALHYIIFANV